MDSVQLIVYFLLVFGKNFNQVKAQGIFDPVVNIFDPGQHENTPNKVIDPFLSPMRGSDDEEPEQLNEGGGHQNPKAWWDSTTPPVIDNIYKDQGRTTPDYDKIVANRFPGAVSLLEKLKELNKQKEQQKHNNSGAEDKNTPKPFEYTTTNDNNGGEKTTEKTAKDKVTKHLTKNKFYFQAQPVRPEGEHVKTKETVYYVDDD